MLAVHWNLLLVQVLDQACDWGLGGIAGLCCAPPTLPLVCKVSVLGDSVHSGCLPAVAMEACRHSLDTGPTILAELSGSHVWKLVSLFPVDWVT